MRITREGYLPQWATGGPASGTVIEDPGGDMGGAPVSLQEFIALFFSGTIGPFLRNTLGGLDIVQALGTLGATALLDLANASVFWGTMDQDVTISTTGWTNLRNATVIVELIEDGTGDWLPTIDGVTWVTAPPTAAAAGEVIQVVLRSRDGGTTIWGAVIGGDASSADLLALIAKAFGYSAHGSMGATETFDAATGWHSGTFTANCTFTLTADVADTSSLFLELAAGAGGFTLTLPASVVNAAALEAAQDTTAGTTSFLVLLSRDGGTTWHGGWWGGSGGATALDDLTDVTITAVAADDTLQYDGADWVNSSRRWEPVTFDPGTGPEIVFDATDVVMTWETY